MHQVGFYGQLNEHKIKEHEKKTCCVVEHKKLKNQPLSLECNFRESQMIIKAAIAWLILVP